MTTNNGTTPDMVKEQSEVGGSDDRTVTEPKDSKPLQSGRNSRSGPTYVLQEKKKYKKSNKKFEVLNTLNNYRDRTIELDTNNECVNLDIQPDNLKKIQKLPDYLFEEMVLDVYDEIKRRELEKNESFRNFIVAKEYSDSSSKINKSRQNLAHYENNKFKKIVSTILIEINRRWQIKLNYDDKVETSKLSNESDSLKTKVEEVTKDDNDLKCDDDFKTTLLDVVMKVSNNDASDENSALMKTKQFPGFIVNLQECIDKCWNNKTSSVEFVAGIKRIRSAIELLNDQLVNTNDTLAKTAVSSLHEDCNSLSELQLENTYFEERVRERFVRMAGASKILIDRNCTSVLFMSQPTS